MSWSAGEVLQASAAWVSPWFPPDAVHVDLGWLEFYVTDGAATVMRVPPSPPGHEQRPHLSYGGSASGFTGSGRCSRSAGH